MVPSLRLSSRASSAKTSTPDTTPRTAVALRHQGGCWSQREAKPGDRGTFHSTPHPVHYPTSLVALVGVSKREGARIKHCDVPDTLLPLLVIHIN